MRSIFFISSLFYAYVQQRLALWGMVLIVVLVGASSIRSPAHADGTATLVKDINVGPARFDEGGSAPYRFTLVGDTMFFFANDGSNGRELWKTDGTPAGTILVRDLSPGPDSTSSVASISFKNMLYFASGHSLWQSDGTAAGTRPVASVGAALAFVIIDDTLFFFADDGTGFGSYDLWKSDGTTTGTTLVKQLGTPVQSVLPVGNMLFFSCSSAATGTELCKSDGTPEGTGVVKDIYAGNTSSYPTQFTALNGQLYFLATNALWKSDGTAAGTVVVKNVDAGDLRTVQGTLFLSVRHHELYDTVVELWKSDGTEGGTVPVKEIERGSALYKLNHSFTPVGNTLFFTDNEGQSLWTSDGTANGTLLVKQMPVRSLANVNGTLFFAGNDSQNGWEPWTSDGTAANTKIVKNIAPGAADSLDSSNIYFAFVNKNGTIFFSAFRSDVGLELWKTDGTAAGTDLFKDINPQAGGAFDGSPPELTLMNGTLYFVASDGLKGEELWRSDGTADSTQMVADINPREGSFPGNLTAIGDTLFFQANDETHRYELWRSDGTAAGTRLVKDISQGAYDGIHGNDGPFAHLGATIFFVAENNQTGVEVWKSDGTEQGTVLVKDIFPGSRSSYPDNLTVVNETLYFTADDGQSGSELWRSDGTEAGTMLVKDIWPGTQSGLYHITQFAHVNNTLFFKATDGVTGSELWRSDGTAAGTMLVKDILPGVQEGLYSTRPMVWNDTLFFNANDGEHGVELWRSDGTAAGTLLVSDINAGPGSSYARGLTVLNGAMLFAADTKDDRSVLWRSDGTAAGTTRVTGNQTGDVFVRGLLFALPSNGVALFSAYQSDTGIELWQTDGTVQGTVLLQEFAPGPGSSYPREFIVFGSQLWLVANDNQHGTELWSIDSVPRALVAGEMQITVAQGGAFSGTLQAYGAESDPVSYQIVRNGSNGTATITDASTGAFAYIPQPDASGDDSFTYSVSDGTRESNEATVRITITSTTSTGSRIYLPAIQQ